jgi:UDP-N-acetylglucosamine enolpyruvyl transferase
MTNGDEPPKVLQFGITGLTTVMIQTFGQTAFGIAALLIMWQVIMKPQLELQRIDYKQNQEIVDKLREIGVNQLATASSIERTSVILGELVKEIKDAHR